MTRWNKRAAASGQLRKIDPTIKIMMLTGTEVDDRVYDLVAAGIEGYVLKNIEPAELVRALHAVGQGEAYLHLNHRHSRLAWVSDFVET